MTLIVDFNMVNQDGLVPALVPQDDLWKVHKGEKVLATDGEGTECWGEVVEAVDGPRGPYVLLAPIDGIWNHDAVIDVGKGSLASR